MIFFVVLAVGFAAGLIATVLVPGRRRLSLPGTTVAGIVGAGAGLTLAELLGGGTTVARFLLAVTGAVVVVVAAQAVKARVAPPVPPTDPPAVLDLIAQGESGSVELKGSARRNQQTGQKDGRLELTIAKSVAGFLNADGGTLLIGVADDGAVVGLEDDYRLTDKHNRDGYELWLRNYLAQRLGTEALPDVAITFEDVNGLDVCRVDIAPARRPVFLSEPGRRTADLYVRMGNTTRRLLTDEAIAYTARRYPAGAE